MTVAEQREAIELWNETFKGVWFYWLSEDDVDEPEVAGKRDPETGK